MTKKMKYITGLVVLILLIGSFIGFQVLKKSTQENLENNKWYLVQSDGTYKAQFNKDVLTVETALMNITVNYKIEADNGTEYMLINSSNVKNQKYKFVKTSTGYKATAVNKNAKEPSAVGSFQLNERK